MLHKETEVHINCDWISLASRLLWVRDDMAPLCHRETFDEKFP